MDTQISGRLASRLAQIEERFEELTHLLADAGTIANREAFQTLSREYGELEPVVTIVKQLRQLSQAQTEAEVLRQDRDTELRSMANEELARIAEHQMALNQALQAQLLPRDPNDARNLFLEVRAGTGGQEAALFAGDLMRAYTRYAERQGWKVEILSAQDGEAGGYREVIARVIGRGAYSQLKFESGTHRVQRIPSTESQGRIHTSACTVAILPEADDIDAVDINPSELRIDTYRSSGAGGQHVNTTDSAVRITHLPSGIVVECQDERSQHKNKARALSLLAARLLESQQQAARSQQAAARKLQVGSGDRSERIRTYNFPQGRVTDHRINLTRHDLSQVMEGELQPLIEALQQAHQADLLAELG